MKTLIITGLLAIIPLATAAEARILIDATQGPITIIDATGR